MLDLLFGALALALVGILLLLLLVACLAFVGMEAAGAVLERLMELVIPGRKTGLGASGIVGQHGIVVRPLGGRGTPGTIRVSGELWSARSDTGGVFEKGRSVRVVAVEGMVALVSDAGGDCFGHGQ